MTRKDVIFYTILFLYLLFAFFNIFVKVIMKPEYCSFVLIGAMVPLVLIKTFNRKFANWLEKKI